MNKPNFQQFEEIKLKNVTVEGEARKSLINELYKEIEHHLL